VLGGVARRVDGRTHIYLTMTLQSAALARSTKTFARVGAPVQSLSCELRVRFEELLSHICSVSQCPPPPCCAC